MARMGERVTRGNRSRWWGCRRDLQAVRQVHARGHNARGLLQRRRRESVEAVTRHELPGGSASLPRRSSDPSRGIVVEPAPRVQVSQARLNL